MAMTPQQLRSIKLEWLSLATYFNRALDDITVRLYAEDLADLPYDATVRAMRQARRERGRRFCPLPADIVDMVQPGELSALSQAQDIAGRITKAITRWGYTSPDLAHDFIGEVGWRVVERKGGWQQLCQTLLSKEMGTFFAQCRDLAQAEIEAQRRQAPAGPCPERLQASPLQRALEAKAG